MVSKGPFFTGFNRLLFGRKPLSGISLLARQRQQADQLCLAQLAVLLDGVLPDWLLAFKTTEGANSRHRKFTTLITFWAFLSQVLDTGGCCRRAVARIQVLWASRGLALPSNNTAAYCTARARLPIRLLLRVSRFLTNQLLTGGGHQEGSAGGRLLVLDGTSVTLADTASNAAQYAHAPGQQPSCGFPILHLLGLFDWRTGAWLALAKGSSKKHQSRMAWRLLKHLRAGDVLLADRAFCSYAWISELQKRGVQVVLRLHQARSHDLRQGRHLGPNERLQTWVKPLQCPPGLSRPSGVNCLPPKRCG